MLTAKISVVIPNYNYAQYLPTRIESILNQSFQDFELIYVDDGSTDQSNEIIQKYLPDSRIKVRIFESNSGQPYQRWKDGAAVALGEYLIFAEADDYCAPQMLEKLVNVLDYYPNVGLAFCRSILIDQQGEEIHADIDSDERIFDHDFVMSGEKMRLKMFQPYNNCIPNASAVLMRRSMFQNYGTVETTMRLCHDWLVWFRILEHSDVGYVSEPLNFFRVHNNSVRTSMSKHYFLQQEEECVQVLSCAARSLNLPSDKRNMLAEKLLQTAIPVFRLVSKKRGLRYLMRAFEYDFFDSLNLILRRIARRILPFR